jgi:hypothetical protein
MSTQKISSDIDVYPDKFILCSNPGKVQVLCACFAILYFFAHIQGKLVSVNQPHDESTQIISLA